MEEAQRDLQSVPPSLTAAVRRARVEEAERSEVLAELRGAEVARLEMLRDAIAPVLAQVPDTIDLFDVGLAPGEHPRLFIDMIGFVEMGRDRRGYRFVQDTRHGRVTIVESERLEVMVDAVRNYIARRLVEREKALAADLTIENAARAYSAATLKSEAPAQMHLEHATRLAARRNIIAEEPPSDRRDIDVDDEDEEPRRGFFMRFIIRLIEILGSLVFGMLAVAAIYAALKYGIPYWVAHMGAIR